MAMKPAANKAPPSVGLSAAARLRGTAVKLAAAGRSAGVTTAITKAERVGTSICDSALRRNSSANASGSVGENAAPIRHRLAGMCVNTMVLSRPMRSATLGASHCEAVVSKPAQKKKAPACAAEKPKRVDSHSASSALTTSPPAKASTLNSSARRTTTGRDTPSGALAAGLAWPGSMGSPRYKAQTPRPTAP
jgi:hypothetical protein